MLKIFFKDGSEKWLLVHIEIQGYYNEDFPFRMYTTFYRIMDKFKRQVIALAILTDEVKSYKPDQYHYNFFQTELIYKYRLYKVISHNKAELIKSQNPFSLAVLAVLYLIKAKKDIHSKYNYKLKLTRLLFEKGFAKEKIINILLFIDAILSLTLELENKYNEELLKLETRSNYMPGMQEVISGIGRKSYYKGKEEGKLEGKIQIAKKMLNEGLDIEMIIKVTNLSEEEIEKPQQEL